MRWLAVILIFITASVFAQDPVIRRVCQNGNDNNIYWTNPNYPCSNFHFYIVWASFDNVSFFPVDTITNSTDDFRTHSNANSSAGVPNRYYYIERRDSCGPVFNHNSNIVIVDVENRDYSYLDSVSVDINTNHVNIGWRKNPSPDFNLYFLYKFAGTYVTLNPGGTKDTFLIDASGSDPSTGALQYDINTTDSCGNPSTFGTNPHSTMFLTNSIDTCKRMVDLKWTPYVGWTSVKFYYIFEKSGSGFILIDSTTNLQFSKSITLGTTYEYFVRAQKDTSIITTSSSNKNIITTNPRPDPSFIIINKVTTNAPFSQNLYINFSADPSGISKKYILEILDSNYNKTSESSYSNADMNQDLDLGIIGNKNYFFKISSIDVCDLPSISSDSSGNIYLQTGTVTRSLKWNPYFTWNNGIEYYNIYRGTGENDVYQFNLWQISADTSIIDTSSYYNEKSYGVCYYVEAKKSGEPVLSKSNIICFPGSLSVIIPNAFVPDGLNQYFRPEGMAIDYQKSSIEIYDRWGQKIYHNIINNGWDGRDDKGNYCIDGLYLYKINIISIKNENQTKTGTITLIR